jgi:mono/diheme cytochrome c family protein
MRQRPIGRAGFALLGAALVATAGCDSRPPPKVALRPDDPQSVELGHKVYQQRCAACHGAQLEGQPRWRERDSTGRFPAPPHDASGHTWHHPDDLLFRITKYGVAKASNLKDYDSAMPAFEGDHTDAEIVAVLSWIKAQWAPEIRKHQEEINAESLRNK